MSNEFDYTDLDDSVIYDPTTIVTEDIVTVALRETVATPTEGNGMTFVCTLDNIVTFISFDDYRRYALAIYDQLAEPYYVNKHGSRGSFIMVVKTYSAQHDTFHYASFKVTDRDEVNDVFDEFSLGALESEFSLDESDTTEKTKRALGLSGGETIEEVYERYTSDPNFRLTMNRFIPQQDEYLTADEYAEIVSKQHIRRYFKRLPTPSAMREHIIRERTLDMMDKGFTAKQVEVFVDRYVPKLTKKVENGSKILSKGLVKRAINSMNRMVIKVDEEFWASTVSHHPITLCFDYIEFKLIPATGIKVGKIPKGDLLKSPDSIFSTIISGDYSVTIADPMKKLKKKAQKRYNCFLECARYAMKDNKDLETYITYCEKYRDDDSFDIEIDDAFVRKVSIAANITIRVYTIRTNKYELYKEHVIKNSSAVLSIGLIKKHAVLIDDVKKTTEKVAKKNVIAFYDLESVQDNRSKLQVPFMAGYKIGYLNKESYEGLLFLRKSCTEEEVYKAALNIVDIQSVHIFEGSTCIADLYQQIVADYEKYSSRITIFGYNSTGYDNYFMAEHVASLNPDKTQVNISLMKSRLYLTTRHATFRDISPLVAPGSLMSHCYGYNLVLKKRKGDVDFNFLNYVYNETCNRDLGLFIHTLKSHQSRSLSPFDGSTQSIYEAIKTYNYFDLFATEELAIAIKMYADKLFNAALESQGLKYDVDYLSFDTLGQASMALFSVLNEIDVSDDTVRCLSRKNKKRQYNYQAILDSNVMEVYDMLRRSTIASISHAYESFNSEISKVFNKHLLEDAAGSYFSVADVVSLYPTVMIKGDARFGYGRLEKGDNNTLDLSNPQDWKLGIYYVAMVPNDIGRRMRRLPYKEDSVSAIFEGFGADGKPIMRFDTTKQRENFVYQWHHNKVIYRPLYQQDIDNYVKAGHGFVGYIHSYYTFEHETTADKIFSDYITPFMIEKNRQDQLKAINSKDYSPGIREMCKGFMNIMSGKMVQVYDYDTETKITHRSQTPTDVPISSSVGEYDVYTLNKMLPWDANYENEEWMKKFGDEKDYYDYSLVGAQIYCHSREFMHSNLIDKCYDLGYEPLIIETDSLTTNSEFFAEHMLENPTINILGGTHSLYNTPGVTKVFGQLEMELEGVHTLMIHGKKSYFMKYTIPGQDGRPPRGATKFRFKGVTATGSVLLDTDEEHDLVDDYCALERLSPENARVLFKAAGSTKDQAWARDCVMRYYYSLLEKKSLANPIHQESLFRRLIAGQRVSVMRPSLKKNISTVTKKGDSFTCCISGYIAQKTFNRSEKESSQTNLSHNINRLLDTLESFESIELEMHE